MVVVLVVGKRFVVNHVGQSQRGLVVVVVHDGYILYEAI